MKSIPLLYRVLIVLGVLTISVALIFIDVRDIKHPTFRKQTNVNLGLDLRGGSYLVMQVQTMDAIRDETDTVAGRVQKDLEDKKIFRPEFNTPVAPGQEPRQAVVREGDDSVLLILPSPEGVDEAMKTIDLYAR